jgi:homoserine O-acetyltransferase
MLPHSPLTRRWASGRPLHLELGGTLDSYTLGYRTWGRLSPTADNAVFVCHALTGSADADEWWSPLFGPGKALDPARDFIICSNVLGGCNGSTGATSSDPQGRRYGHRFPALTIRDQVRAKMNLADALGVRSVSMVVGGSMGGLHALEWALLDPKRVRSLAVIAASARHSAWCRAWSETQRMALRSDPAFLDGKYAPEAPPTTGLGVARAIAMTTYRCPKVFEHRHGAAGSDGNNDVGARDSQSVHAWLRHHAERFAGRFDANTYLTLIDAMDRHDIGRHRGGIAEALRRVGQPALVVSIQSDGLYVPSEQREICKYLPHAEYVEIASDHGHDGFLIDAAMLEPHLSRFHEGQRRPTESAVAEGSLA